METQHLTNKIPELENKGKRREEIIKENFPELENMSKRKVPELSKGKNRSQAKIKN